MNMKIAGLETGRGALLAPMAGITDDIFRRICHENGCALSYTEMISAKGFVYSGEPEGLLEYKGDYGPVGLQLFGSEPYYMAKAAEALESRPFALVDINMGCPAKKINKNGDGAALMRNIKAARDIIRAVRGATQKPVTVKMRLGWDRDVSLDFALMAEDAGADAICIHGRTREQQYSGSADMEPLYRVKQAIKIPLIANGDIKGPSDAEKALALTGADAVMIGRAALGNPWVFAAMLSGRDEDVSADRKIGMALRHLDETLGIMPEKIAVREMRKHIAWYIKGLPGSAAVRNRINGITGAEELKDALRAYEASLICKI